MSCVSATISRSLISPLSVDSGKLSMFEVLSEDLFFMVYPDLSTETRLSILESQ